MESSGESDVIKLGALQFVKQILHSVHLITGLCHCEYWYVRCVWNNMEHIKGIHYYYGYHKGISLLNFFPKTMWVPMHLVSKS